MDFDVGINVDLQILGKGNYPKSSIKLLKATKLNSMVL